MVRIEKETTVVNACNVLNQIPEFDGNFSREYLSSRLSSKSIILVAYLNDLPVACKIVYDRYMDGSIYSWLGGVVMNARNKNIAQALQSELEKIAKIRGYQSIVFKTRNKFNAMLQLALKNGFQIIYFEKKNNISESRIVLKKTL